MGATKDFGGRGSGAQTPGFEFASKLAFGGSALRSHPKKARPLAGRQALHLVLRSTHAHGPRSFLLKAREFDRLIRRQAEDFGVQMLELANAGDHFHIVAKFPSRKAYRGFVRAISGLIPRRVLGAEKGKPWGVKQGESGSRGTGVTRTGPASGGEFGSRFPVGPQTGPPKGRAGRARFWDARPFTRIVGDGKEVSRLRRYVRQNRATLDAIKSLSRKRLLESVDRIAASGVLTATGFS